MRATVATTCQHCGKSFQVQPYRLSRGRGQYCSPACHYADVKRDPAKWTECTCQRCGRKFTVLASIAKRGKGKYCSRECHFPPTYATCQNCGKPFQTSPSTGQRFCSKTCAYDSPERSQHAHEALVTAWQDPATRQHLMDGIARRSDMPEWYGAPHFQKGPAHPRYKGNRRGRECETSRYQYKVWHKAVLAKDNYTCQDCGERGGRLTAHHVQAWAKVPELRYDVSNGVALCYPCHDKRHGRMRKPLTRECAHCGQTFQLHKNRQRYCSIKCAAQHRACLNA